MIVVGLGARGGAEVDGPVRAVLDAAGIPVERVTVLATIDRRAGEERVRALAEAYGWRLVAFPAAELAAVPVPNPGRAAEAAVGSPSVAEAAALLAAGPGARLIVPKRVFPGATVAVAVYLADGHSCTGTFSCIGGR
ncbi:cobalamin biosynthesis protein [Actinoplanes sp. GCM10030250]|uniref:cobalamin biosynthesis protein n=1 Tax=Actinoplanes sp. GCM10030250 TaxID=3273376 RepID=UPI003613FB0B